MKQKIVLEEFPFNKNAKKTRQKMQDIMKCFLIGIDYEIFCKLIAFGYFETEDWNLEPFLHRFGKVIDVRMEEKNKQYEDKKIEVQGV